MRRIILAVFCLSGWSVSSCLPRQYHYVAENMTWTEAQTYCRRTYTDLATIDSPEEMKQVNKTISLSGLNPEVWIGLYRQFLWKWSDNYTGSGAESLTWAEGQPVEELCVIYVDEFYVVTCYNMHTFFCYRGSQQDPEFVFVNIRLTWSSAQRYCRENYIDLVTVRNDKEIQKIRSLRPSDSWPWIGLYRDPHDYWSDGSSSKFRYWENAAHHLFTRSDTCGVADLERSGKWRLRPCESRFPFVCYSVPQTAVRRQVIKLRMKLEGPSLDLNDPAVKANIMKKLQDRLKGSRLNGVTLKWREQPDGKVFHKEGESSQEKDGEKREL